MNISLVFPPFYMEAMYNLPPLGLINLATMITNLDHKITIHDFVFDIRAKNLKMGPRIYDDCSQAIIDKNPDVVAFSAQCTTYPAVLNIAKKIKGKKQNTKIVIGGHNASFLDKQTLSLFPWIDAVIRSEGELTFKEIISAYNKGRNEADISGVTYRSANRIIQNDYRPLIANLDDLPIADYSFVSSLSEYRDTCNIERSIVILEVGRGCPHRCVYCSESMMWQRKTRTFSAERIVKEMRHLYENHNAECFLLAYDQFTANRTFVENVCKQIIKEKLNHLPWYCISRLDTVDKDLLKKMKNAGCESMCYGIDSGSKKTLAFINKKIDTAILYRRVKQTTKQGIIPTLSFVIGFPEEEKEDIDATLLLALKTGILGNINPLLQMPTVLPGTDLFQQYNNQLVRNVDTYFSLGLEFDKEKRLASDNTLIDTYPLVFSSFYNTPCPGRSLEELHLITSYFPLIINLYPKSFLLLSVALQQSIGDLFINFLQWIKNKCSRNQLILDGSDCYQYLFKYAQHLLNQHEISMWHHLCEIFDYESISNTIGQLSHKKDTCNIDIYQTCVPYPELKKNAIVATFEHDIPKIIDDLKKGIMTSEYPYKRVWIVFMHRNNEVEITEINRFGNDFLNLCNGSNSIKAICDTLYPIYGKDLSEKAFFKECEIALTGLGDLDLITINLPANSIERR
jgi:radical SAM superfamily enzyme YgiQ (UPF0313 family)